MNKAKRSPARTMLRILLVLLLIAAALLLGLYALLMRRAGSLQAGSAFQFEYQIGSTGAEPSLAYSVLEDLDACAGTLSGIYADGSLHVELYAAGKEEPFTDLYLEDGQALLNVRQIYRSFLAGLTQNFAFVSSLIPDWTRGDYVSQAQLATLLGTEPAVAETGSISQALFLLPYTQRVHPENGLDGYLYFSPGAIGESGTTLTVGLPLQSLWSEYFRCQILIDIPSSGLHVELTGRALPGEYGIELPGSRMRDEDIAVLADIWQAVQAIVSLVKNGANRP